MTKRTEGAAPAQLQVRVLLCEDAGLARPDFCGFSREAGNLDLYVKVASIENTVQPTEEPQAPQLVTF